MSPLLTSGLPPGQGTPSAAAASLRPRGGTRRRSALPRRDPDCAAPTARAVSSSSVVAGVTPPSRAGAAGAGPGARGQTDGGERWGVSSRRGTGERRSRPCWGGRGTALLLGPMQALTSRPNPGAQPAAPRVCGRWGRACPRLSPWALPRHQGCPGHPGQPRDPAASPSGGHSPRLFFIFLFLPKTPVPSAAGPGRGVHDKDKAVSGLSATGGGQGLREGAVGQSPGGACDLGPSLPGAPSATAAPPLPPSARCGQSPPSLDPPGPCPDPSVGANVKLLPPPEPPPLLCTRGSGRPPAATAPGLAATVP